jgi:hypothetical protein
MWFLILLLAVVVGLVAIGISSELRNGINGSGG